MNTQTNNQANKRPEPLFKNGRFVPAYPIPDPREIHEYRWYDGLLALPKIINNPLETFTEAEYRDPHVIFKILGSEMITINSPELIQHCFIENRDNYGFSAIRQRLLRALLGDGLISAEGAKWQHARRAMSPMFTPRNVTKFADTMKQTTLREMPNFLETEGTLNIAKPMASLTFLVLSDTLFSGNIDEAQTDLLEDVATALNHMGRPDPLDIFNAPDWMPRITRVKGMKAVNNIRQAVRNLIKERKKEKESGKILPDDFLTRLLNVGSGQDDKETHAFDDEEITDHLLAFIGAGHETTARALSWLFYLLSNDVTARKKLEKEVDALDIDTVPAEEWLSHLPYTMACFEETMRLFPPAPFIARKVLEDDHYTYENGEEITLNKNAVLMLDTWILHRHKKLWDAPNSFIPERFLGSEREKISRFQYLPFGVGARVCIGQRFALQEAAILITLLARQYRFDYAGTTAPWPKMRITIQPDNNMPMRVTRRTTV